ncbi:MAG: 6,7-dimethyl-8-ribityllumazine synthase [Gammaproteobacteria bacterium]|nr:6,7-dimethyl-8-ribityllumazine synthase [Gammaproteobacteria bacterium]
MIRNIRAENIKSTFNIGIITSRFNHEITEPLCQGAIDRLHELGFTNDNITTVWVPGAVEIPLTAQRLAKTQHYEVLIALGAVIQGETRHMDYVCDQVSQGCQQVMLAHDIPIIFGVLTTNNERQAIERIGGKHGHKGRDAADAAYEMVSVLRQIKSL